MSRSVAILAFDPCDTLDVVGPLEVFSLANQALARAGGRRGGYAVSVVGLRGGPIHSESGLRIVPRTTLARAVNGGIHTLVVTGGAGARRASKLRSSVMSVLRAARKARRVASVCTGAFVLASTGLLDRRRATTHWAFCDELANLHPKVRVESDPIYVCDGGVWTSAGVTAGIDLALALVEEDLGRDVAAAVARWLVVFVRRAGGQSQFSAQLSVQTAERRPIRDLMSFIVEHPEATLAVSVLAARAGMSPRHFSRVFRDQTGITPAEFVERARVDHAQRLLESTRRGVKEVASASGFGSADALRRAFARRVRLNPTEFRARFAALPKVDETAARLPKYQRSHHEST